MSIKTEKTSEVLLFTITSRDVNETTVYQATADIGPGWGPTSVKRPDGSITYPNRSVLIKAINRRAASLNRKPEIVCGNKTEITVTTKSKSKSKYNKTSSVAAV